MTMAKEDFKLVFVGHIDHGKSTLIGRLLYDTKSLPPDRFEEIRQTCKSLGKDFEYGFVLDHLQEEREQGITIDTTQIFFSTEKRDYTIIDAPGHKEFLKNMITGASQAEVAILIVDGEEGVQEQTKRHAYLLSFLGIKQIIVVINKMDLVDYSEDRFNEVREKLLAFLQSINISPTYVIPVSAKMGDNVALKAENMQWYSGMSLLESLDTFKHQSIEGKPLRFPVQDVYEVDGRRILVGRVESGRIQAGHIVKLLPSERKVEVGTIEVFEKRRTEAGAGESIGITLASASEVQRGEVICGADQPPTPTTRFKAEIFWMAPSPLKLGEEITLKCATQEVRCCLRQILRKMNSSTLEVIEENSDELRETEAVEAIIETEEPVVVESFNDVPELGRFVLEHDMVTVAGGIVKEIG